VKRNFQIGSTLALGLLLASTAWGAGGKLYRWVDKNGAVQFSDVVPPESVRQERAVINKSGQPVEILAGEKTPAQLAEEQRRQQAAQQAKLQAAQDQLLIQSYATEQEITGVWQSRMAEIKRLLEIAKGRDQDLRQQLAKINAQRQFLVNKQQPIPANLEQNIEQRRQELAANDRYISDRLDELKNNEQHYQAELARFRELKHMIASGSISSP
jgi:hypothetical protein